jgi:hypothetical protein
MVERGRRDVGQDVVGGGGWAGETLGPDDSGAIAGERGRDLARDGEKVQSASCW